MLENPISQGCISVGPVNIFGRRSHFWPEITASQMTWIVEDQTMPRMPHGMAACMNAIALAPARLWGCNRVLSVRVSFASENH